MVCRLMELKPDIEVLFEFNGERKSPTYSGFRCPHILREDAWATGQHEYFDIEELPAGGTAKGTIAFINPEYYPKTIWIGKIIPFWDGRIIGHATVKKIFNPDLEAINPSN